MHSLRICIEGLRKALKLQKWSKYWGLKGTGTRYNQKVIYTESRGQNLWSKAQKVKLNGNRKL